MVSDKWYGLEALPAGRLKIRVWWYAHGTPRQFEVARVFDRGKWYWQREVSEREYAVVPPLKGSERAAWAPEPHCWQPVTDAWVWPGETPAPLAPHLVPRFVGTRSLNQATAEAEDAELAREVAAGQAQARSQVGERTGERPTEAPGMEWRWWRDATAIRYEPQGEVSEPMAEGRVMRALAHCGAMRKETLPSPQSFLASVVAAAEYTEAGAAEVYVPRFQPLPSDLADFDRAMAWVAALNPPEEWHKKRKAWSLNRTQRVMVWRALDRPLSFADIGHELKLSRTRARQIYQDGIAACWRVANGRPATRRIKPVDHMAALRERNRAHRMGPGQ